MHNRVMAGKKALGAWFQQCRLKVGNVGIETFKKLMSSLVESSMLYIRNRDLGVLLEFRGIGAGASYVLWG